MQYSLRRWTYDIHNNITEEKTWLTLQSENSASGLTRTICNTYDKQNRLIRVTDNLGAEVKYTYNSIGKRTSEERKVNAEETQLIKYLYDETGRLTDRAEKLNQKRKGTWWAHTRYAYDAMDRLTSETVTDHISGQKNTTNFAYDKAGNDWAQHYNLDEWPKYRDEMVGREGRLGWNYDLHHIISKRYGGPNEWWNMIPAANPEEHQSGIHRGGHKKLFPRVKKRMV